MHDGWKSLREMRSLSTMKGVTVHNLQQFCGLWHVSGGAPQLSAVSSSKAGVHLHVREAEIDALYFSCLMLLV